MKWDAFRFSLDIYSQKEHTHIYIPPVSCCFPVSLVWWEGSISNLTSSVVLANSWVASRTVQCSVDVPSMDSRWSPACNAPHLVQQKDRENKEGSSSQLFQKCLFLCCLKAVCRLHKLAHISRLQNWSAWCLCFSYCGSDFFFLNEFAMMWESIVTDLHSQPVQLTEVISGLVSALTQSSSASCIF